MKAFDHKLIRGRIIRGDSGDGIHGLSVAVWCGNGCQMVVAGIAVTGRDGRFAICDECGLCDNASSCDIHLVITDCTGRIIHDTREECSGCSAGRSDETDVVLVPDVLWWHLKCCESWACPGDALVPARIIDEIEEAFEHIARDRQYHVHELSDCLRRSVPAVVGFGSILDDACAALEGDLDAAARYRDFLQVICADAATACCCGTDSSFAALLDDLWGDAAQLSPSEDQGTEHDADALEAEPQAVAATTDCCKDAKSDPKCPCAPTVVDHDRALAAMIAALHVACGHGPTARVYLGALLDQLCRLEFLGALHRAAVGASCGDHRAIAHFRDLVEILLRRCGPACCCPSCLDERLTECLRAAVAAWAEVECYRVVRVQPERACPGDRIRICGENFGCVPGRVVFFGKQGQDTDPTVEPDLWCENRIDVTVPKGAGCGLRLEMPARTVNVCGKLIEIRPTGCIEQGFEGTAAEILKFTVKGLQDGACLRPGEPLRIRWKTCAADHVRVEIVNRGTGAIIAVQDPADARGRWDFLATKFTSTTEIAIRITVNGICTPPSSSRTIDFVFQNQPDLQIDGIEITQAIQHYRAALHLTDPADRGPDNSLRLVTDKTAWVRVYLRSGQSPSFDGGTLPGVTGSLTVERRTGGVWNQIAVLASQNGPLAAQDDFATYDAERGDIDATLNFVVPAALMTGLLRFRADVASPYPQCPGNSATETRLADVNLTQTLNAAFISIGYNGPNATNTGNLVLPAPTLAQCQAETSWAMTTYPVSGQPNVRIAASFVTGTPLDDPRSCPGCCSPNWQPLLQTVAALVALDQLAFPGGNWVYYGLINNGIPVNVPGCNGWGGTGGLASRPITYAHEIGHQFGLPHARCGNAGAGNAAYPVYEPYDLPVDVPANPVSSTTWTMASIGEYGLDINDGSIANPADSQDFMSYCFPRWISRFTHNFLVNIAQLTPVVIPTGFGGGALRVISDSEPNFSRPDEIAPFIDIFAVLDGGAVEVTSVARLETRHLASHGRPTVYRAELLDDQGSAIAADTVYGFASEGCCCGSDGGKGCDDRFDPKRPLLLRAMIDDVAEGSTLRILDPDGEVVWERRKPEKAPKLQSVSASVDKSGEITIKWRSQTEESANRHVSIRWSPDGGETWRALRVEVRDSSVSVDPSVLPGGKVRFQVLLNDGFSTVSAETADLELEETPPAVAILYPDPGGRVPADRLMHLRGTVDRVEGASTEDATLIWYIDGKEVGRIADLWVETPGPGEHELRLDAIHRDQRAQAVSRFLVQ